jgi:hypothetical protein
MSSAMRLDRSTRQPGAGEGHSAHAIPGGDRTAAVRTTSGTRRGLLALALAGGAVLALGGLGGCATTSSVSSDVSTFGSWPEGRAAGSFAFERLPSQQARAEETEMLEAAAQPALLKAGFRPVAEGEQPDVLVQVGARSSRSDPRLWDDPIWWRGGFGYWRYGPWHGPSWALSAHYQNPRWEREVAVLIRDRSSGQPLFEARASSEGTMRSGSALFGAMYEAALMDFPRTGVNPRKVRVTLP